MALTPKQEKFCQNIVSGMDNKSSYLDAYDSHSEATAWVESTKLLKRDDIKERLAELRKPIELDIQAKQISARQQQIDFINSRIKLCMEKEDETSIIRYTDMLNKFYGLYKEETDTNSKQSDISNLPTDALLKIVETA